MAEERDAAAGPIDGLGDTDFGDNKCWREAGASGDALVFNFLRN